MQAKRPVVQFNSNGESGNIFHIIGKCGQALHKQHRINDYNTMRDRVIESTSYRNALAIVREYVDLIDIDGKY